MNELKFLKKLLGIDDSYESIYEVEKDFMKFKEAYER
jgi:hypothetical protein